MIRLFLFAVFIIGCPISIARADNSEMTKSAIALQKIEVVLGQNPDDPLLLKSHAEIATWDGKYKRAISSYKSY